MIVKLLLHYGADLTLENQDGISCLELGLNSSTNSISSYFYYLHREKKNQVLG